MNEMYAMTVCAIRWKVQKNEKNRTQVFKNKTTMHFEKLAAKQMDG